MSYFDYAKAAKEAKIPPDKLELICEIFRKDYPHDEMLYELHVLRACMAVRAGMVSLDAILQDVPASKV